MIVGRTFHILGLTAEKADLYPWDDLKKAGMRSFDVEDLSCLYVCFWGIRCIRYWVQYLDGI